MFGEACPGRHIRFIKISRHQTGKKPKQPRDLISDFQTRSTSGIVFPRHNRLIPTSCLHNQQNIWYAFCLLPWSVTSSPQHPCLARTDLLYGQLHWIQCKHKEHSAFLLSHSRVDTGETHLRNSKDETKMSYLKAPEKDRIRIQVFWAVWAQNWTLQVKIFSKQCFWKKLFPFEMFMYYFNLLNSKLAQCYSERPFPQILLFKYPSFTLSPWSC